MSLNTVIAFALLLKKITRNGSVGKTNFRNKMRKSSPNQQQQQQQQQQKPAVANNKMISSLDCSSEDEEEKEAIVLEYNNNDCNLINNATSSIISLQQSKHNSLKQPLEELQRLSIHKESQVVVTATPVTVRDFAYPIDSPLHFGEPCILKNQASTISLSSPDFNGRDATALFDFSPETEYEIGLKAGQSIWVQYRQCPGWLIADVQDETGLIPESYVEFI